MIAQSEVAGGYRSASATASVGLFALLLLVLLAALLLSQRHLSRTTRRTFNLPLLAATALTVLLGLGSAVIVTSQGAHLDRAEQTGSTPAAQLAEARIEALRARGDEALTLAAHGSGGAYEQDFAAARTGLDRAMANPYVPGETRTAYRSYLAAHEKVRELDDGADYDGAVRLAIGAPTTATFQAVTDGLRTALTARMASFTDQIGAAGRGLGLLTVLGPLLALIVCGLATAGIRARLEEYR